jgi:hypothetical protein
MRAIAGLVLKILAVLVVFSQASKAGIGMEANLERGLTGAANRVGISASNVNGLWKAFGGATFRPNFSKSSLSPYTTRKAALHFCFEWEALAALTRSFERGIRLSRPFSFQMDLPVAFRVPHIRADLRWISQPRSRWAIELPIK